MKQVCGVCQSTDFTIEDCGRVCTTCGDVQEEFDDDNRLCMIPDNDAVVDNFRNKNLEINNRLTARIRGETNSYETKRRISREKLSDEMRRIVKQLIKQPNSVDETMDLINSTFKAYSGRLLKAKKLGLVGACIYYLSAKNQLGLSLSDICKVLGIKMKVISVCMKQVRQLCPEFEFERLNIKDLVKKYIDELASKHYDLDALEVQNLVKNCPHSQPTRNPKGVHPLIENKDKVVLYSRVMLLIELFEAMHPYNQPTPQSLIVAVVYHAWRSLDTFKIIGVNLIQNLAAPNLSTEKTKVLEQLEERQQNLKKQTKVKHLINFEKFCQICDLNYSSNGYKIVTKLQSSLLMLGQHLGNVNKANLPWYLKDIIDNSTYLIQEHNRNESVAKKLNDRHLKDYQV